MGGSGNPLDLQIEHVNLQVVSQFVPRNGELIRPMAAPQSEAGTPNAHPPVTEGRYEPPIRPGHRQPRQSVDGQNPTGDDVSFRRHFCCMLAFCPGVGMIRL